MGQMLPLCLLTKTSLGALVAAVHLHSYSIHIFIIKDAAFSRILRNKAVKSYNQKLLTKDNRIRIFRPVTTFTFFYITYTAVSNS